MNRFGFFAYKRADIIAIVLLLLLALAIFFPRRATPIDLRMDAAVYYVLGTSLAHGAGYSLLNEPGDISAVQYPPFVPGIIAADQVVLRSSGILSIGRSLKWLWFVLFLFLLYFTYTFLRAELSVPWAFIGVFMCLINVQLLFYSNQCTAEIPFATISMAFVLLHRKRPKANLLAAILAIAAFFCRTIGIALFGAWIVDALARKHFRHAILRSSLAAVCLLSWVLYIHWVEQSPEYKHPAYPYQRAAYLFYNVSYQKNVSYKNPFQPELGRASLLDRLRRFWMNAQAIPESLGEAVSTYKLYWNKIPASINRQIGLDLIPSNLGSIVMNMIGWLILAGTVLLLKRDSLAAVYVILTVFIACLAPWQQITRYALPIVPLLLYAFFEALRKMRASAITSGWRWGRPLAGGFIYVCLAVIVAQQAVSCVTALRYSRSETYRTAQGALVHFPQLLYQDQDVALEQATYWVRDHAAPSDILAAAMPQWVYLKTGLKTVMPPLESDPKRAESLLDAVPVRYLILEKQSRMGDFVLRYMSSVVRAFPKQWIPVYSDAEGAVQVFKHQISKPY